MLFHILFMATLYYKLQNMLLQNAIVILLQYAKKVIYKICQLFYNKMQQFYYKMRQLLQAILVQAILN